MKHFVEIYWCPSPEAARPVAEEEVAQMMGALRDQRPQHAATVSTRKLST